MGYAFFDWSFKCHYITINVFILSQDVESSDEDESTTTESEDEIVQPPPPTDVYMDAMIIGQCWCMNCEQICCHIQY